MLKQHMLRHGFLPAVVVSCTMPSYAQMITSVYKPVWTNRSRQACLWLYDLL